ncbi:hypothetical protein [Noviherbaspirillum cavernae]|nr:hypothetical protein [Noviherbaspirillum cavernae]
MQSTMVLCVIGALLGGAMGLAQSASDNAPELKRSGLPGKFDERLNAADQDRDGALTREEAARGNINTILENFDRLDINKDGKLTREEMRTLVRNKMSM